MEILVRTPQGPITTVVDEEDADLACLRWSMAGGKGSRGKYASRREGRTTVYLHRVIALRMGLVERVAGEGRARGSVDHVNGDKLDNRRRNLRLATRAQQMTNGNDGLRSTNRSGYRGVSFVKRRERFGKPWMAYVTVNYKTINLGWYATVEEAAAARRAWDERQE